MILQYLGILIGLILNIFAIPIALFFGPILGVVAICDELSRRRWEDNRPNENRQRAQESLDALLRRKDLIQDDSSDSSNGSIGSPYYLRPSYPDEYLRNGYRGFEDYDHERMLS